MASGARRDVEHRLSRGRSLPETKSKTDSGCFVDEEIEKLLTSGAGGKSIAHALSLSKEAARKRAEREAKEPIKCSNLGGKLDGEPVHEPAGVDDVTRTGMGDESGKTDGSVEEESFGGALGSQQDGLNRRASRDFYCLCYDESDEEQEAELLTINSQVTQATSPTSPDDLDNVTGTANGKTHRPPGKIPPRGAENAGRQEQTFHSELNIVIGSKGHVPLASGEDDDIGFGKDGPAPGGARRGDWSPETLPAHREKQRMVISRSGCDDRRQAVVSSNASLRNSKQETAPPYKKNQRISAEVKQTNRSELKKEQQALRSDSAPRRDWSRESVPGPARFRAGDQSNLPNAETSRNREELALGSPRLHSTPMNDSRARYVSLVPEDALGSGDCADEPDGVLAERCSERTPDSSVLSRVKALEKSQVQRANSEPNKRRPVSVAGYPARWNSDVKVFPAGGASDESLALKHRSWSGSGADFGRPSAQTPGGHERSVLSGVQGFEELMQAPESLNDAPIPHPAGQQTGNLARLLLDSLVPPGPPFPGGVVRDSGGSVMQAPESLNDAPIPDPAGQQTGDLARLLLDSLVPTGPPGSGGVERDSGGSVIPNRIVEGAREDVLSSIALRNRSPSLERSRGSFSERRGSTDANRSAAWKRRSWSVCDKTTRDLAFPFLDGTPYPQSGAKTASARPYHDYRASPQVRRLQNSEALPRRHSNSADVRQPSDPGLARASSGAELGRQARGPSQYWPDRNSVRSDEDFTRRGSDRWKRDPRLSESCYDTSSASDFSANEIEASFPLRRTPQSQLANGKRRLEFSDRSESDPGAWNGGAFDPGVDPRVRELRKVSRTPSWSSSDSEVERSLAEPVQPQSPFNQPPRKRTSAVEALFGRNSPRAVTPVGEEVRRTSAVEALFGRNSPRPATPIGEDLLQGFGSGLLSSAGLPPRAQEPQDESPGKEENKSAESASVDLEFDDTDYSEFYTRCEDKESILTAEAIHVKEVLAKMADAPPTEPNAPESLTDGTESSFSETDYLSDSCSVAIQTEGEGDVRVAFRRRDRGTQTPPPYSPVKNMATCDKGAQTPTPPSPGSRAISAEELLEILSSLSTGNLSVPVPRRPVRKSLSVQRYHYRPDFPGSEGRCSSTGSISTGSENSRRSSEHQRPTRERRKLYPGKCEPPPPYSQSFDCIRRDLSKQDEKAASRARIHEELLKYKEARSDPALFEEEVDCVKARSEGDIISEKREKKRPVSICYVGSEPTEAIEAEVRLSGPVHSLKRRRPGRAIVEEGPGAEEVVIRADEPVESDAASEMTSTTEGGEDSDNSYDASDEGTEVCTEGELKEGESDDGDVSVFIDYRKKRVMHVVCNSKPNQENDHAERSPPPAELESSPPRVVEEPPTNAYDKELYSIREERSPPYDAESITSSEGDGDPFCDFAGSNETVVFVGNAGAADKVMDAELLDSMLGMGLGNGLANGLDAAPGGEAVRGLDLDAILGSVRETADFDVLDSCVLHQAIERFKQRVSPGSRQKLTGGMTMEAFVALNQADELESIINGIKGELKLLQEENSILREKVVNFENEQAMETKLSGKVNIARESGASGKKESAKISPDSRVQTQPVSQKKEEGERPQLTACHDKTPVKPSGKVSTPSAVYKTSTKNHQTANGVDKSMTNGTLEGSTTPQAPHPTSVRVDVHNGCEPVVNTPRATRHAQSEQPGSKDKLAETPVGKLNGVYERQPTRHRKTGKEPAVSPERGAEPVQMDVFLRGFTMVPGVPIPLKKTDVRLGTVTARHSQEDLGELIEAAKTTFVDHVRRIDDESCLGLGRHSIQGVQAGLVTWTPGSLKKQDSRVAFSKRSNPCVIQLKDGNHFSCDTVVYDTLLPRELVESYALQLLEHRFLIFCGVARMGKSFLAAKLAEQVVQRIGWNKSPAVLTFNVGDMSRKDLKQKLSALMKCDVSNAPSGTPAVIILDQLNCLASMSDIFDVSQLEGNTNSPYIIGVRDKSKKGPFTSKDLNLHKYFRWIQVSVFDRQYFGMLERFLKRKLCWAGLTDKEGSQRLLGLFEWLASVWKHINDVILVYCDQDATLGPSVFFSCPMNFKAAEGWFTCVWNYTIIPHLHQKLRMGTKIFDRDIAWEDPTRWVIMRYPWDRESSKSLATLKKLRQVDIVLNRNQNGQESAASAQCHEVDERIRRSHSLRSPRSTGPFSSTPRNSSTYSVRYSAKLGTGV